MFGTDGPSTHVESIGKDELPSCNEKRYISAGAASEDIHHAVILAMCPYARDVRLQCATSRLLPLDKHREGTARGE